MKNLINADYYANLMQKVMVFGTFDILHKGHINFLKQANKYGKLIVVIGTDNNVEKIKNKKPLHNINKRIQQIRELQIADKIIEGYEDDFFKIIEEKMPDVICLGYDQNTYGLRKKINDREWNISVVRLKPFKEKTYKSSILRQTLF